MTGGTCEKITDSPDATRAVAAALAGRFARDAIVWLSGPLAAGKTQFVAGVVEGLGGDSEQVSSPTYALIHEYRLPAGLVFHLDLYRLARPQDVYGLALDDLIGRGPVLIEWPERAEGALGRPTWKIDIGLAGPNRRRLIVAGPE